MKLYPRNRHLVVELIEKDRTEEEETRFLLPEDYQKKQSPFLQVRVKETSLDCNLKVARGDNIVIERSMLQEVEVDKNKFYLVLENYVYGVLADK